MEWICQWLAGQCLGDLTAPELGEGACWLCRAPCPWRPSGTWAHPCLPHNAMGTLALFVLLFLGGDNFWEVENNWIHIGPPREKD